MTEFVSKQVQIHRADHTVFDVLADFEHFTPIVKDKIDDWQATQQTCSFKIHGITIKLAMVERTPYSTIKLTGQDMPFEFYFWVQLKRIDDFNTRMRLTVHAKLNPMMKMMLGGKLQKGIDHLADQIANAFNSSPNQ